MKSLRDGNFFATTGEILIRNYGVAGAGNQRTVTADVEWTFRLSFVEVVWSDGKKVDRQVISATDSAPFGTKHFAIPFDAAGKAWLRPTSSSGSTGYIGFNLWRLAMVSTSECTSIGFAMCT